MSRRRGWDAVAGRLLPSHALVPAPLSPRVVAFTTMQFVVGVMAIPVTAIRAALRPKAEQMMQCAEQPPMGTLIMWKELPRDGRCITSEGHHILPVGRGIGALRAVRIYSS
mmetsp:Transcript_5079/g.12780  ORF Transcript_5079/g.12780 Transcript_5079/m.12780 type:complete len:111 (-) Transcript_5079:483-815(-)